VAPTDERDENDTPGPLDRLYETIRAAIRPLTQFHLDCSECGASGTVTETRARRLDELTGKQLSFLLMGNIENDPMVSTEEETPQAGSPGQLPAMNGTPPGATSSQSGQTHKPGNFPRPD
jgi:hypothetical protein